MSKALWLNDQLEAFAAYQSYAASREEKRTRRKQMEKILKIAIRNDLTKRQRTCIELYYHKNMKVSDIAEQLKIRPTTVYKHLKMARRVLQRAAEYL